MQTNSESRGKQDKQFPVELPSRQNSLESTPITDVVEHETYPLGVDGTNAARNQSGVHVSIYDDITEVAAIDAVADTENISASELFK